MKIDFIYDVATPNGYLAHKVIPKFEEKNDVIFNYIPCLAGGIFKLTGNKPPLIANQNVKNKTDYFFNEMNRFIKTHNINKFKNNTTFPQNSLNIQRGAVAAKELGILKDYVECTMSAMWEKDLNIQDEAILKIALEESQIDYDVIFEMMNEQKYKDKLIENTSWAVEKGAFGIPTFIVDDEIFFGKDHMHYLEYYIQSKKR
ncbi:MAG: disulfide bond formation protein DsbA [Gammaproteobacteria bacterium]|nr:disulfide bond formation protein DsbA [Gammaproteobacteria bacterium]|tara:strand:- start:2 stop:607 length:606 start_codon:yes stop_codon:yes gene_type:complete